MPKNARFSKHNTGYIFTDTIHYKL